MSGGEQRTSVTEPASSAQKLVWTLVALLIAKRIAYHLAYIVLDPFALGTFSDGQLYELAARDILAHAPFGSEPFYLQGLYAYLLAIPMAVVPKVVMGLWVQLILAAFALLIFQRSARSMFGRLCGGLSLCVLLACPEPAFYENKYLSVSLGLAMNTVAIYTAVRAFDRMWLRDVLLAGVGAALALLARPNLALAIPFTALAFLILARSRQLDGRRVLLVFAAGVVLGLSPMALRNQVVVGSPQIAPSHGGGVPFYIGNNEFSNGRWNTAGGMFTGMVFVEKYDLAKKLAIPIKGKPVAQLDAEIGAALYGKAFDYIREDPARFVRLLGDKLWLTVGNHRFVRDYDIRGERELIGPYHNLGLPFGAVIALGVLGFFAVARRAQLVRGERPKLVALLLVLGGQVIAILLANVLVFTSAQNRVPLAIPLAFVAGPALEALYAKLRGASSRGHGALARFEARPFAIALALLCGAQAFWPRMEKVSRPSSAHYYNLAAVEENLGRLEEAATHFNHARTRNPRQPMFHLSYGRVLRRLGLFDEARAVLVRIKTMPNVSSELHEMAHLEIMSAALGIRDADPSRSPAAPAHVPEGAASGEMR